MNTSVATVCLSLLVFSIRYFFVIRQFGGVVIWGDILFGYLISTAYIFIIMLLSSYFGATGAASFAKKCHERQDSRENNGAADSLIHRGGKLLLLALVPALLLIVVDIILAAIAYSMWERTIFVAIRNSVAATVILALIYLLFGVYGLRLALRGKPYHGLLIGWPVVAVLIVWEFRMRIFYQGLNILIPAACALIVWVTLAWITPVRGMTDRATTM